MDAICTCAEKRIVFTLYDYMIYIIHSYIYIYLHIRYGSIIHERASQNIKHANFMESNMNGFWCPQMWLENSRQGQSVNFPASQEGFPRWVS